MYKVRGADQNEYGPISAEMVRQWIRQRRLISVSLAQVEGTSEWKPLSAFPEFAEALAGPVTPPPMPGTLPSAAVSKRSSGLAISSLVLGILGFLTCGITALIGLIFGVVSLVQVKRGKVSGRGFAIAGIILSCLSLLAVPVAVGIVVPMLEKGQFGKRGNNNNNSCENNLKQIGLAARMYALDHGNAFPPNFVALSNDLMSPKVLVCTADVLKSKADDWADVTSGNISYELLVPGRSAEEIYTMPAIRCPFHKTVCLGNGTIRKDKK